MDLKISTRAPLIWGLFILIISIVAYRFYDNGKKREEDILPPREAWVDIKVESINDFNDPYQRVSGIAEVVKTTIYLDYLRGSKVSFFLKKSDTLEDIYPGDILTVSSVVYRTYNLSEQNSFDSYLYRKGIRHRLARGEILNRLNEPSAFYVYLGKAKKRMEQYLSSEDNKTLNNLYIAMLLGRKGLMSNENKLSYSLTGTMHFFAISGLHIGVIALCLFAIFRIFRLNDFYSFLIGIPILLFYVFVIGAPASAMRAFLMILFIYSAVLFGRKPVPFAGLVASAIIALIINPNQIFDLGFQLSYAVVFGLLVYGVPLGNFLSNKYRLYKNLIDSDLSFSKRLKRFNLDWFLKSAAISFSAGVISIPFSVGYFKILPLVSLLLNVILVPIVSFIVSMGFGSILLNLLGFSFLGNCMNFCAIKSISLMEYLIYFSKDLPYAYLNFDGHGVYWINLSIVGLISLLYILSKLWKFEKPWLFTIPVIYLIGVITLT